MRTRLQSSLHTNKQNLSGTSHTNCTRSTAVSAAETERSENTRVQVGRQGHTLSRTFCLKHEAEAWARDQEARIDRGERAQATDPVSRESTRAAASLSPAISATIKRTCS